MRRFRLLFLLFSLALLAPLGLLVHRALGSLSLERQMRQQTVAERIFDEMERGLSRLLEGEEEQPFDRYGADVPARDPPFILGRFQIDPDGSIRALPLDAPLGGEATNEITNAIAAYWREPRHGAVAPPANAAQLPGTTVQVYKGDGADTASPAPAREEKGARREVSAFDALRSLNKGVLERADRQNQAGEYESRDEAAAATGPRAKHRAALALGDALAGSARSEIDFPPMTGRVIDGRHLMLHRTVAWGKQAYRQGVLLDVERLATWLREQGLGSDGLEAYASVSFATPFTTAAAGTANSLSLFRHRFAEPFDDLTARLELRPLPGLGSVTYVYTLSALLLASGVFGLAALYRMVSVVVSYAERRSNFVAAVSHELKTPLTAIRMYGEMLRDGMVPSEAKRDEYYRHITVESERLSRLINNVLELSRLEKGKRDVALVVGSPEPVVREVAELLRPHARERGFELDLDIEDNLPPVRFERDALVQVLCNLVDNAVKYASDASDKRIALSCRRAGDQVSVGARDRGPGVPPRHLGKIFEPFYRGEDELTRRNKGVGLGLALVQGLAERMGARVSGRNVSGGGFEVEILLRAE